MKASDILLSLEFRDLQVSKDAGGKITVHYVCCYVKDGYFLDGYSGRGQTFDEACEDYLNYIRGKTLVFDPDSNSRKEVKVLG